jgi:hypothetical protein
MFQSCLLVSVSSMMWSTSLPASVLPSRRHCSHNPFARLMTNCRAFRHSDEAYTSGCRAITSSPQASFTTHADITVSPSCITVLYPSLSTFTAYFNGCLLIAFSSACTNANNAVDFACIKAVYTCYCSKGLPGIIDTRSLSNSSMCLTICSMGLIIVHTLSHFEK